MFLTKQVLAEMCAYATWDWDTIQKKSVNQQKIVKPKSGLSLEEQGSYSKCSVCEEDQSEVTIEGIPRFKICREFQKKVVQAIQKAKASGFPILSVVGCRVGKSKGAMNSSGLRTQFSNHSFGTAIDFNSEKNGLYDFCLQFGPSCKLIRGGEYQVGSAGSITKDSAIYKEMTSLSFKWGGEINGKQKDFMHFSLDGMQADRLCGDFN